MLENEKLTNLNNQLSIDLTNLKLQLQSTNNELSNKKKNNNNNDSQIDAKNKEIIEVLTERNNLKLKLEELLKNNISQEQQFYNCKEELKVSKHLFESNKTELNQKLTEEKKKLNEFKLIKNEEVNTLQKDIEKYKNKNK